VAVWSIEANKIEKKKRGKKEKKIPRVAVVLAQPRLTILQQITRGLSEVG
jgi:hypothetical protein